MKRQLALALILLCAAAKAQAHAHVPHIDESNPDAWKIKLCGQMSDIAVQALSDRDKNRPMKLYEEDGEPAKLANAIIRRVYEEPQIGSPKKAMVFGRGQCNEFLEKR
jgi:hypothetical protein